MTTNMVFSMGFAATSLGVARATLDAATDLARGKTPQGLKAMRDNNAVQGLIGRTEASLRAARAYLYTTAAEVWRDLSRGDAITEQHRIALRIAATWTIHQSAVRGRHRLSHGRRHRRVQRQQVRAAVSRHARHRPADPGARYPLRGRRQGDPFRQPRHARRCDGKRSRECPDTCMKSRRGKLPATDAAKKPHSNSASAVEAVFDAYPKPVKARLLALRRLIFDTAKATEGVGAWRKRLKWGQPSYLTPETKSGSTIRIDQVKEAAGPIRGLLPLPDQSGRDLPRALSGTALWRQPEHSAQRRRKAARSRAAPLRGAGVDISFRKRKSREGEIDFTVIASHRVARTRAR